MLLLLVVTTRLIPGDKRKKYSDARLEQLSVDRMTRSRFTSVSHLCIVVRHGLAGYGHQEPSEDDFCSPFDQAYAHDQAECPSLEDDLYVRVHIRQRTSLTKRSPLLFHQPTCKS